jgi:hypothetical protein
MTVLYRSDRGRSNTEGGKKKKKKKRKKKKPGHAVAGLWGARGNRGGTT